LLLIYPVAWGLTYCCVFGEIKLPMICGLLAVHPRLKIQKYSQGAWCPTMHCPLCSIQSPKIAERPDTAAQMLNTILLLFYSITTWVGWWMRNFRVSRYSVIVPLPGPNFFFDFPTSASTPNTFPLSQNQALVRFLFYFSFRSNGDPPCRPCRLCFRLVTHRSAPL